MGNDIVCKCIFYDHFQVEKKLFLQITGVQTIDQYSLNTLTSVVNAQTHDFYTCVNCHTMQANIELFSLKSCQEKK